MALAVPLLPGLPALVPVRKGRRRCAPSLDHGWRCTPLWPQAPEQALCDFLTFWYARVHADGEHASLWGELGLSPSRFVLTFTQVPLFVVHDDRLPWHNSAGLLMVGWIDDVVVGVRARCHQWVAPPYRHPRVSTPLANSILRVLFADAGFLMLEGRTPADNHLGIRAARRLGFRPVATLPYGEWAWTLEGTKTITPVVQSVLTVNEWHARQEETDALSL